MRPDLTPQDSLELLLDTICNTFGAIIFVALLVALLSEQDPLARSAATPISPESIEREIATAEQNLAELNQEIAKREKSQSPADQLAARERELEKEIADLKTAAEAAPTTGSVSSSIEASAASIEQAKGAIESERVRQASLENAIATMTNNIERLTQRLAALDVSTRKLDEARTKVLRFPKERPRTKDALFVIFRYGKVYPCFLAPGEINRDAFFIEETESEISFKPKPDGGIPQADIKRAVAQLLSGWKSEDVYFTCLVYADSATAFNAFTEVVQSGGFEFGWRPRSGASIVFSSEGDAPPPPL